MININNPEGRCFESRSSEGKLGSRETQTLCDKHCNQLWESAALDLSNLEIIQFLLNSTCENKVKTKQHLELRGLFFHNVHVHVLFV